MLSRDRSGYLPSLDGWRCVAIVGVLWAHDFDFERLAWPTLARDHVIGGFGVALFYAISGFLIAWRILRDEEKTGRFRLKEFYVRRFFRIQPPQWVFLAFVAVLMVLRLVHVTWYYWLGALFLYENFLWHNVADLARVIRESLVVGHFWTLAVEEHFYLLISLYFFLVKRRRAALLGVGLLALVAGQHWAQHRGLFSPDVSSRRTYWNIQWLLFASWTALALDKARALLWAKRYLQPWLVFVATGLLLVGHNVYTFGRITFEPYGLAFGNAELLSFCFTGWIVATALHPESLTTRVLEWRALRFVGRISYSLYIWHVIFFLLFDPRICSWLWIVRMNAPPWKYICTFAVAILSYYGVEKPMIRLGHRLTSSRRSVAHEADFVSL